MLVNGCPQLVSLGLFPSPLCILLFSSMKMVVDQNKKCMKMAMPFLLHLYKFLHRKKKTKQKKNEEKSSKSHTYIKLVEVYPTLLDLQSAIIFVLEYLHYLNPFKHVETELETEIHSCVALIGKPLSLNKGKRKF